MTWMIYGATGFTGRLVAERAVDRGLKPVLAGRDPAKLAEVAVPLGLPTRVFDLRDADAVAGALADVDVVAHCAGPFSATSAPMVDGCLRAGVHYLDITGEAAVFEAIFARRAEAEGAGVVLLPGAGFDVVPTDCLAAMVAAKLPTATDLDLAFQARGGISGGTLKSALEGAAQGGLARLSGQLRTVPMGWRRREVPFPSGPQEVTSLPWGDVVTAFHSTGIPNITTFARLPGLAQAGPKTTALGRKVLGNPVAQRLGKALISRLVSGPDAARRARSRVEVVAEAADAEGRTASAGLVGPDTYDFTADAVLHAVEGLRGGAVPAGVHTPSTAFGADFVRRMDGIRIVED